MLSKKSEAGAPVPHRKTSLEEKVAEDIMSFVPETVPLKQQQQRRQPCLINIAQQQEHPSQM